jgi:alpha-L-fucosidase 2
LGPEAVADPARALLREASPWWQVKRGLPPFLLVHGTGDVTVPYAQSTAFQARLRAAGVTCDLQTVPDGAHGMLNWTKLAPDYAAPIVAWLQRTLGGARSARP